MRPMVVFMAVVAIVAMLAPTTQALAASSRVLMPDPPDAQALPLPPTPTVQTGVYVPGGAQNPHLLDAFDGLVGDPSQIIHWYQPWGYTQGWYQSVLDTRALEATTARQATPLITWEAWGTVNGADPSHVANISTGVFDDYIDSWAMGLRAYGRPVYLRPFHEMNNPSYPWASGQNGNTAADLIAAWRYLHDRFRQAGATNVLWVWSPNTENDQVLFSSVYPGDAYVDWLAVDGYNGGRQFQWGGWLTPDQLFARSLASLHALNATKPIMVAETSSVELGGSKADWISELYSTFLGANPSVRAIVWFHADFTHKGETDWRIDTSNAALEAYRGALDHSASSRSAGVPFPRPSL